MTVPPRVYEKCPTHILLFFFFLFLLQENDLNVLDLTDSVFSPLCIESHLIKY